jgi:hypothetical protein
MASGAWANFFVAQCGASAALLGLLFVSVSLNLTRILAHPHLPERAILAMFLLLTILVIASLMLMPGVPIWASGIEVFAVGSAISAGGVTAKIRDLGRLSSNWRRYYLQDLFLLAVAVAPYLVAGCLLFVESASGFYWLAAAMILSTFKAVSDAWVLLVEINR